MKKDSKNNEKSFEAQAKETFDKLKNPEISFSKFLKFEKQQFELQELVRTAKAAKYIPKLKEGMTPCGNGDFDKKIDEQQWQGAYGDVRNIPSSFVEGFIGGPINNFNSHQTWVTTGTDPNVPISTTAPGSSSSARIGNRVNGYGAELISKTFIVEKTKSTISFWYATVMENPIGHPPSEQPLFWVRVTDAQGNLIPNAFDFGNGSDKLIADRKNPFFKTKGEIVYRDWSCAQIDLTTHIGKQVTIEFISGDCGYGGHWGYAYIDRVCDTCEGSPTGTVHFDCENSKTCGDGELCFNYSLPYTEDSKGNPIIGNIDITIDIYQNGMLISSLSSPSLNSGNRFCFQIKPSTISGLNMALDGFDYVISAKFSIASVPLGSKKIGIKPTGINQGQNNDYLFECKTCDQLRNEQNADLLQQSMSDMNLLKSYDCNCPPSSETDCSCSEKASQASKRCKTLRIPKVEPCVTISWGESECDAMETHDFEVAHINVSNCYENVTFNGFVIHKIVVTDENGKPVDTLPDGKPSIILVPSGPICFGDIPPCLKGKPSTVSRELVIKTAGAKSGKYQIKLMGVCYSTSFNFQEDYCFDLALCKD